MRLSVPVCLLLAGALAGSACETMKAPVAPSKGPWRFTGMVLAMNGSKVSGPISSAELTVVSGVNSNVKVRSDSSGHFAFTALESDIFTVTIDAPGYVSAKPVVNLYDHIDANFALKPR